MKSISIFIMLATLTLCVAQESENLFQQALLKENGEGDLQAAVALYEHIVNDVTAARGCRALAQLHIGICWEKMGIEKASHAYKKVIENFKDQNEIVQQAIERIEKIKETDAEKNRHILPNYLKLFETKEIIYSADYAPNNKWIVYQKGESGATAIYLFHRENHEHELIFENIAKPWLPRVRWSPDGSYIGYLSAGEKEKQDLWLFPISIDSGNPSGRAFKLIEGRSITMFDWHPSERKICFTSSSTNGDSLYTCDVASKKIDMLFFRDCSIMNPCWAENGAAIYFISKGTSGRQSWDVFHYDIKSSEVKQILDRHVLLACFKNKPILATRPIESGSEIIKIMSIENNNYALLDLREELQHSMQMIFSSDGQRILSPAKRDLSKIQQLNLKTKQLTCMSPENGYFYNPLISPSGQFLAYVEDEPSEDILHIRDVEKNSEKLLPLFSVPLLHTWSPNEKIIVYEALYSKMLCSINLQTGIIDTLDWFDLPSWEPPRFSSDGKFLSYVLLHNDKTNLFVLDFSTGENKKLKLPQLIYLLHVGHPIIHQLYFRKTMEDSQKLFDII